jgi:hypothetical protein
MADWDEERGEQGSQWKTVRGHRERGRVRNVDAGRKYNNKNEDRNKQKLGHERKKGKKRIKYYRTK